MVVVLAIETSQREGSVALRDRDGRVHSEPLRTTRRHDDDLLPAIDRLVQCCKLSPRDLSAAAVSIGPGGFTGLRIAVSTAKMFAEALGIPVVPVPSAVVAAEATAVDARSIVVALACKGDTFWATHVQLNDEPTIVGEPGLVRANEFSLEGIEAVLADEHLPAEARRRCGERKVPVIEPRFNAAACLRVGERMLQIGKATDAVKLMPLYPRQPEAVTLWQQR